MGIYKKRIPLSKGVAKVPVIMQMEAVECGAACLATEDFFHLKKSVKNAEFRGMDQILKICIL